ncbi:MAG: hypothetical protein GQ477_02665 [Nanohaloarchaea archaeon]|nr:hypothetical protein [Candidatus Nanohaloarchaea archaeon]
MANINRYKVFMSINRILIGDQMSLRDIMKSMEIRALDGNPESIMPAYSYRHEGDISNEGQKIDPNTHPHNIAAVIDPMLRYGAEGYADTVKPMAEGESDPMNHATSAIARHNETNIIQLEVPYIEDVFNCLPPQIADESINKYGS